MNRIPFKGENDGAAVSKRGAADVNSEDLISISALFSAIWRSKWIIVLSTLLAAILGAVYASRIATPLYSSSAVVMMETREQNVVDLTSVMSGLSGDSAEVNSEVQVLQARGLIGQVVDRLELIDDPEFNPDLREASILSGLIDRLLSSSDMEVERSADYSRNVRARAVNTLIDKLTVRNIPLTLVFEVAVETTDPQKSAVIVDAIIDQYIDNQIGEKFSATDQATAWLTQRVGELQSQLEAAELEVKRFNASTDLVNVDALLLSERQLKDIRERINTLRASIVEVENRVQVLSSGLSVREISNEISDARLNSLLSANGRDLNQDAISSRLKSLQSEADVELSRMRSQLSALIESEAKLASEISSQNEDLIELQQLQREAEATRLLYEYFLTRLKETSAQQGVQQADSKVLSEAVIAVHPSAPKSSLIVLLSGMIGFVLSSACVLFRETRNRSFRSAQELEVIGGKTVVGQVPLLPETSRSSVLEYFREHPTSAAAEAVRNLRTSILLSQVDNPPQVICVSSSLPAEGKTTVSMALAQNFGDTGRKVLLIEGDVRRRTFQSYFSRSASEGLVSSILGECEFENAVFHEDTLGVDVVMGEQSAVNAADLFSSDKFARFMSKVRSIYDIVIVDTPPVLVVPDARIISQSSDVLLFVVKWDSTTKDQVKEAVHMFDTVGVDIDGFVLAQVSQKGMRRYGLAGTYGAYSDYGSNYYSN